MTRLKCSFARLVMKGLAGLLTLPMAACFGATLVVTNMADSGPGSLRQAILDNESLGGGSTIMFSNTLSGSITLVSGELGVTNDLVILGPGSSVLTVSGNNASRVFRIQAGTVSISDLSIAYGQVTAGAGQPGGPGLTARGGGIFVRQTASLAMTHCVVVGNTIVGGVGGPAPSDPGVAGNGGGGLGGGIGNAGTLTLTECTLANNSATGGQGGAAGQFGTPGTGGFGWGGGLYSVGPATLIRCTISGNSVTAGLGFGTAAPGVGYGGGIYNATNLNLATCTVANNLATSTTSDTGGGIYHAGTALTNRNCTIAANQAVVGGGIYNAGTGLDLGSTILSNQASGSAPDCSGTIISSDYNLIRDLTGCTITGATAHNLVSQPAMLGPLQDNGGPTLTKAPFPGSPVVDQGYSFGTTIDQRGRARIFAFPSITAAADGTDIGAVEVIPPSLSIAPAGASVLLSWPTIDQGYILQWSPGLGAPVNWSNVSDTVAVVGGQNTVTNSSANGNAFYRLISH